MVISKNKVYDASAQVTFDFMLQQTKNALKVLGSQEITTQNLDKAFIRFVGKMPPNSPFGSQVSAAVYQEGSKFYVQLKADVEEAEQFWVEFEKNLYVYGSQGDNFELKYEIITQICNTIRQMGGIIDEENAWIFLYNYQKTSGKMPGPDEISQIAVDYVQLNTQQSEAGATTAMYRQDISLEPEVLSGIGGDRIEITPQDALRQMLKEIPTLDAEALDYFFRVMEKWDLDDQQALVNKIKQIEADLNKIPYLLDSERKELRAEVLEYPTEKRRQRLLKAIKERQKDEAFFMVRYAEDQIKAKLRELPFLTAGDITDIMSVILTMPFEEKKKIVDVVKEIEAQFNKMQSQGIEITGIDRKNIRLDLIRLNERERIEEYDKIAERIRAQKVKAILFKEIPQLEFEDHSKILKELLWVNNDELIKRIKQIKANMDKEKAEKTKEFSKSSSASTCKKCGWPMGSFSKKCPRCGWNVDDWFKL
jgi:rubrerythrin